MSGQNQKRDPEKRIRTTEESYTWKGFTFIFGAIAVIVAGIAFACPGLLPWFGSALTVLAGGATLVAHYTRKRYPQSALAITHFSLVAGSLMLIVAQFNKNESWPNLMQRLGQ